MDEILVILDYVLSLLYLSIIRQFCNIHKLEFEEAQPTIVKLLGMDRGRAGAEVKEARSPKVRLS